MFSIVMHRINFLSTVRRNHASELHKRFLFNPQCSYSHTDGEMGMQVEVNSEDQEVAIALGSNMGDRLRNFNTALRMMKFHGINIKRHACLYETSPAYITDQPRFLNSAVRATTKLPPHHLLHILKTIESQMGRTTGIRYGPRPIDLDILFYSNLKVCSDQLIVPHERIYERPFVIAPLVDLLGSEVENDVVASWNSRRSLVDMWNDGMLEKEGMLRVMPVNGQLWDWSEKRTVMGVLNLTPDSFSDGGKFQSVDAAVERVRHMVAEGAEMVDLGAQSTRPMAGLVSPEEELERLIPVLEAVAVMPEMAGKIISVDTFYSQVAAEAVRRGAHIINDVSGGASDAEMAKVMADLEVPYVVMHMRGDPTTMQSEENLRYTNVCEEVGGELYARAAAAEAEGVPAWRIVIDPGIGFSKNTWQNLEILRGIGEIKEEIARKSVGVSRCPLMIGPSRKRFLGEICRRQVAAERDAATVACVTAAVLGGADILRVHNVRDNVDAVKVCDAMQKISC